MSIVTYNNRSIANISAVPGAAKSLTHIKTLTSSCSSSLSFVDGSDDVVLDSTYPIYLFKFINIHPSANATYTRPSLSICKSLKSNRLRFEPPISRQSPEFKQIEPT